jgi:hypothetical protein
VLFRCFAIGLLCCPGDRALGFKGVTDLILIGYPNGHPNGYPDCASWLSKWLSKFSTLVIQMDIQINEKIRDLDNQTAIHLVIHLIWHSWVLAIQMDIQKSGQNPYFG